MGTLPKAWILSLLLFFSMSGKSYAQSENLRFEHLPALQGLSQDLGWRIYQDTEGFMWFGTNDGLYKYDGHTATDYQADPANPAHKLRSNLIMAIHEDQQGRLWVGTGGGGLHQVDKRTEKVTAYPVEVELGNRWNELEFIYEDEQEILWLGTTVGIARFDPATEKYSLYPTPNGKSINSLKEDEQGIFWTSNPEGVYQFDPATGKFTLFPGAANYLIHLDKEGTLWISNRGGVEEGISQMSIHTPGQFKPYNPGGLIKNIVIMGIFEEGGLWLATNEGLQHVDLKTNQVITYQSDPSQPGSLNSNQVWSVYKDRTGNLWVGTINGVNKASLHTKPFRTYQITPTPVSFHRPENEIYSVLEDHTGTVWLSSATKGLYQIDTQTQQLKHVVVNPDDKRTSMLAQGWPLAEDHQGQLWVGTDMEKGLYRLDRTTGKFIRYPCAFPVRMLEVDASGKLWVGGWLDEIASFDPATGQFTYYKADEKDAASLTPGYIGDLLVSRSGEVWVGTTSGMSRLNPKTGKFTSYHPDPKAPPGHHLNDHLVPSLYEDQEGILWIGTSHGGLNRMDPHTNTFTYFTTKDGLPSNRIESIMGDERGKLWLGTSQGLSCFDLIAKSFLNFDVSDGLPGNEFSGRGSVFRRNGKMYFGNMDGLVTFYPDSIKVNTTIPPVYISGLKVLEKSRPLPKEKLELAYDENFLSFEFVALDYDAPEKNQYAYQLVGLDQDWIYSGTRRFASYTDLDPGQYTFHVKASNNDGVWNGQGASVKFTILSPWWQTWWAYS